MYKQNEYIKKSLSDFRKAFPDFIETKKSYGRKTISVFFDFTMLDDIDDIPEDVKQLLQADSKALKNVTRIDTFSFGNSYKSEYDGLEYYIDFDGITYNIINNKSDRLLYSVIKIKSIRYSSYKANIYGYYEGMPIKSSSYNWSTSVNTPIYDLYYNEIA